MFGEVLQVTRNVQPSLEYGERVLDKLHELQASCFSLFTQ